MYPAFSKFLKNTVHMTPKMVIQRLILSHSKNYEVQANLTCRGVSKGMVEPGGIEPPTPCVQSRCSPS